MMDEVIRIRRPLGPVMKIHKRQDSEMEYLSFPSLEETGLVKHLFTTRRGGVSTGVYSSMNLSFSRGDDTQCVSENYRRVAGALGCCEEDIVCSDQTHTTNIRKVTAQDRGKGVIRPRDYTDIDGLITQEAGIVLATFYADCVPLYFVDTKHRAIGLAHSGWKGTVGKMGACVCRRMEEEFGTQPDDLLTAIGPSICQECYEVSEDVAQAFADALAGTDRILQQINQSGRYDAKPRQVILPGREKGKYQLDLWLANLIILHQAGIPLGQISVTDICTCHNPEYLFSHRASKGRRGNLGAFLMLKKY